jgi:hypothetical protein
LEEELASELAQKNKVAERIGDKAGDLFKARLLDAQYRYDFVSEALGDNSPAKAAAKEADRAAAAEAALNQLTKSIKRAKDLNQVMKYVGQASKNTSPLPELLAESKTTEDIKAVLRIVSEEGNEDLARQLAKEILASTTAEGVGNAFSKIAEAAASAGVQDPEELLNIKLNALAKKFVANADLNLGGVKSAFIKAAREANSR